MLTEYGQHLAFGEQLLMLIVAACFNLNCHLRFVLNIDAQEDLPECTLAQLLDDAKVLGNNAAQVVLHHLLFNYSIKG